MKKLYLFLVLSCLSVVGAYAQSSYYTFQQSTNTYTSVLSSDPSYGTLWTGAWDDGTPVNTTIPFDFNIMGTNFTAGSTVAVASNGWIEFGGTTQYSYSPNTVATTGIFTIAANGQDLAANSTTSGSVVKAVYGTSPNRVFVVEWPNCRHFGGTGQVWYFQIRLYETSNAIQMCYGTFTGAYASLAAYVGVFGTSGTANNWVGRTVPTSGNWNSSSASTSRTSGAAAAICSQISPTTLPTSGLTFTYCPAGTIPTVTVSPTSGCTPVSLTASSSITVTTPVYNWSPSTGLLAATGSTNTANPSTATVYTVTGINAGCQATATTAINPTPSAISGPTAVCTGRSISLTSATTAGAWSSSATGVATVNSSTGVVGGASAGTATITYTKAGCFVVYPITVNQSPSLSVSSTNVFCSNSAGTTITASGTATSYAWTPSATLDVATGSTVIANPAATTIYTVVATLGTCTVVGTNAISYHSVATTLDTTLGGGYVCLPGTSPYFAVVSLTPSTVYASGGTYSTSDPLVATVDVNFGMVYGVSAGTATISYSDIGCSYSVMQDVRVYTGGFSLSITPSPTTYCTSGGPVTLTSSTSGGSADIYLWTNADLSPATGLSSTNTAVTNASPSVSNTYVLSATQSSSGCHAQTTVTVTNNTPVISGGTTTLCTTLTTTWSCTGGAGTWSSGATGIATVNPSTGVILGVAAGVANVTYTVTSSGCYAVRSITVNTTPTLSVSPSGVVSACGGAAVTLTASGATSYSWAPSTGLSATVGASVTANPGAATTYTVTGVTSGCSAIATKLVGYSATALAAVSGAGASTICPGASTTLAAGTTANNSVYTVASTTYSYLTLTSPTSILPLTSGTTDDGYSLLNIPFTFNYFGTNYTQVYVTTNGTVMFGVVPVTTYASLSVPNTGMPFNAISVFQRDMNISGATGSNVYYSTVGTAPNRKFVIQYNNICQFGSTAGGWTAEVVFYETSNVIDMIYASTQAQTYTMAAIQNATGTIGYAAPGRNSIPSVAYSNEAWRFSPRTSALSYAWAPTASVAATAAQTTAVTPPSNTVYTVTVTETGTGCTATSTRSVSLFTPPTVSVAPTVVCAGASMTASGLSIYSWTPATGLSTTTGASVTTSAPSAALTFTVSGTDVNGCAGSATKTVNAIPVVSAVPVLYCSSGGPVAVTATGAATYTWSPATGLSATTGTTVNAAPSATTVYSITGTTAAGCVGSGTTTVTYNVATAPITGASTTLCFPGSLDLNETGTGGTWISSNTAQATVDAAGTVYGVATTSGTPVTITYSNPACGGDATYDVDVVNGGFAVGLSPASGTYCVSGGPVSITASGATTYSWEPATGLSATTGATVTAAPAVTTTYTVTGATGACTNTNTIAVTNATPAAITGGVTTICIGSSTTWTDATGPGTWSSATPGIVTVNPSTGVLTGVSVGSTTITYTVTSTGCYATRGVVVNPTPTIAATPASPVICGTASTTLSASGATTYSWSPSTGLSATTGATVTASLAQSQTYTVTGFDPSGCSAATTRTVNVGPAPTGSIVASAYTVCPGGTTTLTGTGGPTNYSVISIPYSPVTQTSPVSYSAPATGTSDDGYSLLSIPFTFNYFGTNYTQVYVTTNGTVMFGVVPVTTYASLAIPNTGMPLNAISVFQRDMNITGATGSAVIYSTEGVSPTRKFVIKYNNICQFGTTTGGWTAQVVLYEGSNVIDLIYTSTQATTYTMAAVQNSTGTVGVAAPGRNSIASVAYTNESWRFFPTLSTPAYAWSPAGSLSSSTVAAPQATVATATTYSLTVRDAVSGCAMTTPATVSIGIYPNPIGSISPATTVVCPSVPTTLTSPSNAGPGTWSTSAAGVATVNSTTGVVNGVSFGTATITFTNSCGTYTTAAVTVNPVPGTTSGTTNICMGNTSSLSNTIPGGTWTSSDPSIASINAVTGFVTSVSGGSVTISYSTSCGTPAITPFNVNAAPVDINPLTTVDLCVGLTTTLTDASLGGTWTSSNTAIATVGSTSGIVGGVATGTATISYDNGCGAPVSRDVNVNVPPNPSITGTTPVCQNASTIWANAVPGGTWYSANNAVATVDASTGEVFGVSGGTVTISYLTTGCNPATRSMVVRPVPVAIGGATIMCPSNSITLTNASGSGTWSSSNTAVASINPTTGVLTSTTTPGTTTITYDNTCAPAATTVVTVSGTPAAIVGSTPLCAPHSTVLLSQNFNSLVGQVGGTWTTTATGTPSVYNWAVDASGFIAGVTGDGSTYAGANADAAGSGTTLITKLTSPSFSTVGIAAANITLNTYMFSSATWDALSVLEYSVNGGSTWTTIYDYYGTTTGATTWTPGVPNQTLALPAPALGVPSVILRWSYQSSWGFYWVVDNVIVKEVPVTTNVTFTDATPGGSWTSGSTAVATVGTSSGLVTPVAAGTTSISYTACGTPAVFPVTVNTVPGASSGVSIICQGASSTFTNATPRGSWSSSNTAVATVNPTTGVVTGVGGGTAYIYYSTGCGAYATNALTVTATPGTITGATALCPGGSGTLLNSAAGGTWSTASPGNVTVNAATGFAQALGVSGSSSVVTYSNGCSPAASITVTISTTAPITGTTSACASLGSASTIISQNFNSSLTGAIGGTWSIVNTSGNAASLFQLRASPGYVGGVPGDGSQYMQANPNAYFTTNIITEVRTPVFSTIGMTAGTIAYNQYYSGYSASDQVKVDYSLDGGASWTNISLVGGVVTGTTSWSAATPTTTLAIPPAARSQSSVMLRWYLNGVLGGCNWAIDNVVVSGVFNPYVVLTDATPLGTWTSTAPAVASISASGATATVFGLTAGTATISYAAACGTVITNFTVNPAPGAITGSDSVCLGSSISLGNSLSGGTWSTSNASILTVDATTGVATGLTVGTAQISYSTSCGSPTPRTVRVKALPGPIGGFTSLCPSASTTLTNIATGGTWSSSSSSIAAINVNSGLVTATSTPGTTTITYSNGCAPVAQVVVTVSGTVASISGSPTVCRLGTTTLTNATSGGTWSSSNTGIATVGITTGIVGGVAAGTVTISYTGPCGTPVIWPMTVNGAPASVTGAGSFCIGTSITVSNSATGGTWSSVNPAVASVDAATGVVNGLAAGTTTVSYTNGCGTATGASVTVKAVPAAISGATSMCPSSSTFLTNPVSGGTWTSSNPSVATIGLFSGSLNSTSTPGTTTITYTNGCAPDATSVVTVSSSTDTIVGVSSICVLPTPLLSNSFETGVPSSAASPVAGWNYIQGTGAANNYWVGTLGSATANPATSGTPSGGGANVAQFSSKTITAGNTAYLVSPSFDLSGGANGGRFSFYFYRDATAGVASNYDSLAVYINTSAAVGGTRIGSVCRSTTRTTAYVGTAPSAGWVKYTFTIPATFTGSTNYILIKGYSAAGNNMYMDSLLIRNNSASAPFTDATSGGTWSSDAPTVATINSGGVVTALSAGTANISYTGACGAPVTKSLTVNGVPGGNTNGGTVLCVGSTTTIANAFPGGMWSSSAPSVATVDASGNIVALGTGTAVISYFNGCGSAATTAFTVNALPAIASVTPSATSLCAGATLTLTAGSVTGTGTLSSYNWSGPESFSTTSATGINTHIVATSASTGSFSVTVTYPGNGCTSSAAVSTNVTVNDYPVVHNLTGGNACSATGITPGVDVTQSTVVYVLRQLPSTIVQTLSGTGFALPFSAVTTAGSYQVIGTGPGGCQSLMNGTDTVYQTPSMSPGILPNICEGLTSVSIAYTPTVGSPTTFSMNWSPAAEAAGFTDVAGATLTGGTLSLAIPDSGAIGSFSGVLTASNDQCTSAGYSRSLIVYANPVMTVTGTTIPCVGYAGAIDFAGPDSTSVSYTVDGGSVNHFTFSGTAYSLSTGIISAAHQYIITSAYNPVCATAYHDTITITPTPMAWLGGAAGSETDWNTPANWSCGFVPTDYDAVTIATTPYAPVLPSSASASVDNLDVLPGTTVVLSSGSSLFVKGDISNLGEVAGAGKVVLNGTVPQMMRGVGTIANIELNNGNGATIDTGARLMISSTLYLTAGTLTTNDSLELLSSDTFAAARIAAIPPSGASISGRVKTDQYVQGGYRRFRFWGHSFSDTISLSQLQPYIDITGQGGATRGFTTTGSNAPSAFRHDPYFENDTMSYDPGWRPYTDIRTTAADTNRLHPGQGIRLFFRGSKGEGLSYLGYYGMYLPSSSISKMKGHVNQGPVRIYMKQGSVSPEHQSYNQLSNPYPSPVDLGTVLFDARTAGQITGSAFYVWNPAIGAAGQYMAIPLGASAAEPYYIQANTSYQVKAEHDGAYIDFVESNKAASASLNLFRAPSTAVRLNVYDADYHLWDMLSLQFNDKASDNEDKLMDATKPAGPDFNFYSISADGRKLAIDARPYEGDKVIPLGVNSAYKQDFVIRAESIVVPAGGALTLHDKLLNKYVDLKAGTEYKFSISKDKATQGNDRFELSLKPATAATVKSLDVSMAPNPASDDVQITFTSGSKDNVSVRIMDMSGVSIYSKDLGAKQNGVVTVPMSSFAAGVYMVEFTQGEQKVTKRLVKE